jgi:2-keto-4-pentenoate hydratase/2-oxohepta-3-ene-1,7-dioic acid hydratase in catechol pathway
MKRFVRVRVGGAPAWGEVQGDEIVRLSAAPWESPATRGAVRLEGAALLAPATPTKIVAIGRNYRAHAAELGNAPPKEPLLFLKPPSAIVGPGAAIQLPAESAQVEHEGELGVVLGRRARFVRAEDAMEYVFGLTCANDVTARDLQRSDGQWTRAKGFDTFCPVGPAIVTGLDPGDRTVVTRVDGHERQRGHTKDLTFPIPELVAYVSRVMTLEPGDLLLTGTPAGVSKLEAGDRVEVEIDGIGVLVSPVEPLSS